MRRHGSHDRGEWEVRRHFSLFPRSVGCFSCDVRGVGESGKYDRRPRRRVGRIDHECRTIRTNGMNIQANPGSNEMRLSTRATVKISRDEENRRDREERRSGCRQHAVASSLIFAALPRYRPMDALGMPMELSSHCSVVFPTSCLSKYTQSSLQQLASP